MADIPFGFTTKSKVKVENVEYIPDAYEAIMKAVEAGEIVLQRYEELSEAARQWIYNTIHKEYETASEDYKHFLKGKFEFLR